MGILWQAIFSRFKNRLDLSDLHEATDHVYESSMNAMPDMHQALKESEPSVNHGELWREDFSHKLELIAKEYTRSSQAALCRKMIMEATENHAISSKLLDEDTPMVSRLFFDETVFSGIPEEESQAVVAKVFLFHIIDKTALVMLYKQQFNSIIPLNSFDEIYTDMCKLSAEFFFREVVYNLLTNPDNEYKEDEESYKLRTEIFNPADKEFEPIKNQFKDNLSLLTPATPSTTDFNKFKEKWLEKLQPYL